MSVLFPKVNKAPEWDYRPIYYDPEKEKRKQRLARMQKKRQDGEKENEKNEEHQTTLHRGSFREARKNTATGARRTSKLAFWIALLAMLIFCFYFLL